MKKIYNFKLTGGFTLIELLIVIAVIGVLAIGIISIVKPVAQFQKANDARRKSDLSQIQKAIEQYYQDIGSYPPNSADYRIIGLGGNVVGWGAQWLPYIGNLPADPSTSKKYVYVSTGQTYYIYASLDREDDPQACPSRYCTSLSSNDISLTACGALEDICDYGVTSPNVSP